MIFDTKYNIPDTQLNEVNNLLIEYARGNYAYQGKISSQRDEIDTIIQAVNILGQELEHTTVSLDYFSSIFNSSTNLILVLDKTGKILTKNSQVEQYFSDDIVQFKELFSYFSYEQKNYTDAWPVLFEKFQNEHRFKIELYAQSSKLESSVVFSCMASEIKNAYDEFNGYLVVLEDVTDQKNVAQNILKASLDSQQNEQKRVARDLHDSLGQELSALSLMISNLKPFLQENQNCKMIYDSCKEILNESITHLREICFDLMPAALQSGNLLGATKQLFTIISNSNKLKAKLAVDDPTQQLTNLDPSLAVNLYRIIQEFVNNTIKYAGAQNIVLNFKIASEISIRIKDDGVGFDLKKAKGKGNGLENYQTRVEAFSGRCFLKSEINKGTTLEVSIPALKNQSL